jgi:hypothetical protein
MGTNLRRVALRWIAVTGGRSYADYEHVSGVLNEECPGVVVQGECPYGGADALAARWCEENGVPCVGLKALWKKFGNPAGPIRNGWMLDLFPIYKLIAFPGDRGTNNCVKQAHEREVLVRDERNGSPRRARAGSRSDAPTSPNPTPLEEDEK